MGHRAEKGMYGSMKNYRAAKKDGKNFVEPKWMPPSEKTLARWKKRQKPGG